MLTTVNNPWNPFTHYNEWNAWDIGHGYNTASLLARLCHTSLDLSDADNDAIIDATIDDIIELNASGQHKVVTPDSFIR
jgi:hypothetical protein